MAPCWTTSRPAASLNSNGQGDSDVDQCRSQSTSDEGLRNLGRRHRVDRGSGRSPQHAHRGADRAFQDPQERQPRSSGSAQDGGPTPQAAGLPQGQGRGALHRPHQTSGPAPLSAGQPDGSKGRAALCAAFLFGTGAARIIAAATHMPRSSRHPRRHRADFVATPKPWHQRTRTQITRPSTVSQTR